MFGFIDLFLFGCVVITLPFQCTHADFKLPIYNFNLNHVPHHQNQIDIYLKIVPCETYDKLPAASAIRMAFQFESIH